MVNNKEFTKRFARKLNVTQDVADSTIDAFKELIFELLKEDDKIKISDFLLFEKKEVGERNYKSPSTGEIKTTEAYIKLSAKLTDRYKKQ